MNMTFTGERYVPELRGQIYYEHFHRYSLALGLARDKDVLDIACGEGYGTAALALVARTALGVDLDPESVRHAAARYPAMNIDFRAGDCTQVPAADASFDLVVSFETIEHLAQHERMLGEIRRVLRPDGRLIISSPNKLTYSDAKSQQNPFHVRELYFHEFRDMLRAFFPEVRIFGQRIFAASAVHMLRGAAPATQWLGPSVVAEPAMGALPDPEYYIAVCARFEGDALPDLCSVYLDPRDELLADIRSGGLSGVLEETRTALPGGRAALPGGRDAAEHDVAAVAAAEEAAEAVRSRLEELERQLAAAEANASASERELAERTLQLQSASDHGDRLKALLEAEDQRADELQARLDALTAEGARSEAHLAQRERDFVDHVAVVAERQELDRAAHRRLTEHIEELDAQIRKVTAYSEQLERDRRLAVESAEERTAAAQALQQYVEASAESWRDERESMDATLAEQRRRYVADTAGMRDELNVSADRLAAMSRDSLRFAAECEESRAEIARMRAEAAESGRVERESMDALLAEQRRRHEAEAAAMREELGAFAHRLTASSHDVLRFAAECEELRAEVARVRDEAAAANDAWRRSERTVAQMTLERQNADELARRAETAELLLQDVMNSVSWRVTTPARRFLGALRGRAR